MRPTRLPADSKPHEQRDRPQRVTSDVNGRNRPIQLPKLRVAGSIPVVRSFLLHEDHRRAGPRRDGSTLNGDGVRPRIVGVSRGANSTFGLAMTPTLISVRPLVLLVLLARDLFDFSNFARPPPG